MASRFVNHFRNTFLVASTATLAQGIEPGISPWLRQFHIIGPQPPAATRCQCGNPPALIETIQLSMLHKSTAPLRVASSPTMAIKGSSLMRGGASSGKEPSSSKKEKEGRGEPHNLLKVMHYFENAMPLMFDSGLFFLKYNTPLLYTSNIILENHLREPPRTSRGIPQLVLWQNLFRLSYKMRYVANRLIILNQWIDPDEATATLHFRILCVRKVKLRGVKREEADEFLNQTFAKNAEWHDFMLTLHITNHDRVWKMVITQKNPERTPSLKTRLADPLLGLRRRVAQDQELPLPV